ncbi:MAG TPA: biopolymer transporter ExbD [Candidatus Cloacimonadota bacterium]|nr:biopolymer transporter ExbD [Candidatus Cloacimonadota bacterium]
MIKRKRKASSTIPTTSTGDIAFLLIIFFMATTKFDTKIGLGLTLPPAAVEGAQQVKIAEKNMTRIFINKDGQFLVNETLMTQQDLPKLEEMIHKSVTTNPKMVISLKTDREASYNDMIMVLDKLQKAGASKISLSTN